MGSDLLHETKEKRFVALSSIIAAIFLTAMKLLVGLLTGSLGILSEALHSGLDLIAAFMTFFAVKIADAPADKEHNYGHGKIENLSALGETFLLFITCIWIVYEAVSRLVFGHTEIKVTFWSFAVIIVSMIIDFSRSRALMRVAKKYNSQALEADALHFSTDILSSAVVLIGLVASLFNYHFADAISALIVALIVIVISFKLGKKSIDALIDRSPEALHSKIFDLTKSVEEVSKINNIRVRTSGSYTFVDVDIMINPYLTIRQGHEICDHVESNIKSEINRCEVHVHIEPAN